MSALSPLPGYDLSVIRAGLRTVALGRTLEYHESLPSTNTTAIALAQAGACHGTLILADAQTAGRGRRGRVWHSPPGGNLYCSIILHLHPHQAAYLTIIPLASALAVADAIADTTTIQCRLKWPNDVTINDKKVAGLLCENVGGQPAPLVVVGIGINGNSRPDDFPDDIRATATTLLAECGAAVDRALLVSAVMNRLEERIGLLCSAGVSDLLDSYRRRCATLGQYVGAALDDAHAIEGIAEGIGADGSLLIRRREAVDPICSEEIVEIRSADIIHLRNVTGAGPMR
ncbi:MAG TPA: biotin--[acetyl-CoA-carboxylase] ligase [Nitrospiraceae bacterium]|nr:biotin--[acetyl-CoA-carboxylase] ligase [Nitrospiraceae bacterium]